MLQKTTNNWKVQVVAGHHDGEPQPKPVAEELQGDVVDVGPVARQEDDALLLPRGLLGHAAQPQHLLARHVDALVVGPQQQLGDQVIGTPDEALALKLADHVVGEVLGHLLQALDEHGVALGLFDLKVPIVGVEQALLLLDGDARVGQLRDLGLQQPGRHDLGLDVLREARVKDGLADDVVVGAPAGAGDVEGDFAEEAGWRGRQSGPGLKTRDSELSRRRQERWLTAMARSGSGPCSS